MSNFQTNSNSASMEKKQMAEAFSARIKFASVGLLISGMVSISLAFSLKDSNRITEIPQGQALERRISKRSWPNEPLKVTSIRIKDQAEYRPPDAPLIALKAIYQNKPNAQPDANPSSEVVSGDGHETAKFYTEPLVLAFLYGVGLTGIVALLLFLKHQRNCNTKTLDRK